MVNSEEVDKIILDFKIQNLVYDFYEDDKNHYLSILLDDKMKFNIFYKYITILDSVCDYMINKGYSSNVNIFPNEVYENVLDVEFIKVAIPKNNYNNQKNSFNLNDKLPNKKNEFDIIDGIEVSRDFKTNFIEKSMPDDFSSVELNFISDTLKQMNDDFDGPIFGGSEYIYYWTLSNKTVTINKFRTNVYVINYSNFSGIKTEMRYFICYGIRDIERLNSLF